MSAPPAPPDTVIRPVVNDWGIYLAIHTLPAQLRDIHHPKPGLCPLCRLRN